MSLSELFKRAWELLEEREGEVKDASELYLQLLQAGAPILGLTLLTHSGERAYESVEKLHSKLLGARKYDVELLLRQVEEERIHMLLYDELRLLKAGDLVRRISRSRGW